MGKVERDDKQIVPGSFGEAVHRARRSAGIGLDEAGRAAKLSASYLSFIEVGERKPRLELVPAIAAAVEADPETMVWLWLRLYAPSAWEILMKGR